MKVGDLIEANSGERGIVTAVEMMYPKHPESPVGSVAVSWVGESPRWYRQGLMFSPFSVKVVSNAP